MYNIPPELNLHNVMFFIVKVVSLDIGLIVAGTKYRGEFEERIKKLMDEIQRNDNTIVMIDEVSSIQTSEFSASW